MHTLVQLEGQVTRVSLLETAPQSFDAMRRATSPLLSVTSGIGCTVFDHDILSLEVILAPFSRPELITAGLLLSCMHVQPFMEEP